jgi:uncharacterized membrane protein (UPF0127 family)
MTEDPDSLDASAAWLVRDGEVLASAEVPAGRWGRGRGLLGRTGFTGAMVLRPCRSVHTIGMRFPIDVAFCDRAGVVVWADTLAPWRVTRVHPRAHFAIEAAAGAFARWQLRPGDQIEIKE